jgi:Zn-dependent protease
MNIADTIQKIVILTPPILLAVTVHEMCHGWAAWKLGDPTAKSMGRLTLNPFKHLDPVGTLVFFITQAIGWAKPVPVNPAYFKNPKRDMMLVALAGPASNMLLALASAMMLHFIVGPYSMWAEKPGTIMVPLLYMAYVSIQINIGLAVFNLIPIPPLDGSRILEGMLPDRLAARYHELERYGFIIILLLVFTGVTGRIIIPVITYLNRLLVGNII